MDNYLEKYSNLNERDGKKDMEKQHKRLIMV